MVFLFKILGEFYINCWDDNATGKYIPFLYLINLKICVEYK
ncbi:hypothetical protein [Acinetobacter calcoaceticus]